MNRIEHIEGLGIPTNSYTVAVRTVNEERKFKKWTEDQYKHEIVELMGEKVGDEDFTAMPSMKEGFQYVVQMIVKNAQLGEAYQKNDDQLMDEVLELCNKRVEKKKVAKAKSKAKPKATAAKKSGGGKKKGGGKKDICSKLWADGGTKEMKPTCRKEWMALFISEADLTTNGASTYYYNFNKGLWK